MITRRLFDWIAGRPKATPSEEEQARQRAYAELGEAEREHYGSAVAVAEADRRHREALHRAAAAKSRYSEAVTRAIIADLQDPAQGNYDRDGRLRPYSDA